MFHWVGVVISHLDDTQLSVDETQQATNEPLYKVCWLIKGAAGGFSVIISHTFAHEPLSNRNSHSRKWLSATPSLYKIKNKVESHVTGGKYVPFRFKNNLFICVTMQKEVSLQHLPSLWTSSNRSGVVRLWSSHQSSEIFMSRLVSEPCMSTSGNSTPTEGRLYPLLTCPPPSRTSHFMSEVTRPPPEPPSLVTITPETGHVCPWTTSNCAVFYERRRALLKFENAIGI